MPTDDLTADEVRAMLTEAGVDQSDLTITDDPQVWTDIETGKESTSVRIDGPDHARRAASDVLHARRLAVAPYPDQDYWSR